MVLNSHAPHGTRSRYTAGCRCRPCTKANADYARAQYERTRKPVNPPAVTYEWPSEYGISEPEQTANRCPNCDTAMIIPPTRTGVVCPNCEFWQNSNRIAIDSIESDDTEIATRRSQLDIDIASRKLHRDKTMLSSVINNILADATIKIETRSDYEWFRKEIEIAESSSRLQQLATQMKTVKIIRRGWRLDKSIVDYLPESGDDERDDNDDDDDESELESSWPSVSTYASAIAILAPLALTRSQTPALIQALDDKPPFVILSDPTNAGRCGVVISNEPTCSTAVSEQHSIDGTLICRKHFDKLSPHYPSRVKYVRMVAQ